MKEVREGDGFLWNGKNNKSRLYTLIPTRTKYDLFQNKACRAITESKISGNTNVTYLFPGPITIYTSKYYAKSNQKDEQREFQHVVRTTQKMLLQGRVHDGERAEAMRRILRATFHHNTENVVGAPMAAFLTRNRSRFYFSHEFQYCPLHEVVDTIKGRAVKQHIRHMGSMMIIEKAGYDYLCRNADMEDMCLFDMLRNYKTRFMKSDSTTVVPFESTQYFDHPSDIKGKVRQGLELRETPVLVEIPQRMFKDTGNFKDDILDESTEVTAAINYYSMLVLVLFYPFRCEADLTMDGTMNYTEMLREVNRKGELFHGFERILNNIQDSAHNYTRYKIPDELRESTESFKPKDPKILEEMGRVEDDEGEDISALILGDVLFEELEGDSNEMVIDETLDKISFKHICQRGRELDAQEFEISDPVILNHTSRGGPAPPFLMTSDAVTTMIDQIDENDNMVTDTDSTENDSSNGLNDNEWYNASYRDVHRLYLTRQNTLQKLPTKKELVNVIAANGTAASVVDWMKKADLDERQCKAFSTICCQFLLTFHTEESAEEHEEESEGGLSRSTRATLKKEKERLQNMVRLGVKDAKFNDQLIMLLHGPGGSGKSTVIDLVKAYAKQYCQFLDYPYTSNTIVVTAMSGVAATLLGGSTTASKCCLMRSPQSDDVYEWKHTRLLIIDEISFASPGEIETLHKKLSILRNTLKEQSQFGGLHVVFAGNFRQLEPVKKDVLFRKLSMQFDWINCFLELDGMHRFRTDRHWGNLLKQFRDGNATEKDIDEINEECLLRKGKNVPRGIQYASYNNRTRDVINTEVFNKYCRNNRGVDGIVKDAVLIFSDGLMRQNGHKIWEPLLSRRTFYETLSEDEVKVKKFQPRLDPVLKLFRDCPMMLTHNKAVEAGQANGTCASLEQVVLRQGETAFVVTLDDGSKVNAVFTSQVESLVLRHANNDIDEPLFLIKAETYKVNAKWKLPKSLRTANKKHELIPMRMHQFPVVRNTGTTGHKLQGKTVQSILVYDWHYGGNWPYVVLSRVTTMRGVFIRTKLNNDPSKYLVPDELTRFLDGLKGREPDYPPLSGYAECATANPI